MFKRNLNEIRHGRVISFTISFRNVKIPPR